MATLVAQSIVEAGLEASYSAAAGAGDDFINTGREMIHIKNADASDTTITVTAQKSSTTKKGFGAVAKSDSVVVVTAGEERFIGPFPTTAFNDGNGKAQVTYSSVTSLTLAIVSGANLINTTS